MKKSALEKVIENGVHFLSEFFPRKSYLYFPLLSASVLWAVRRRKEWKEKILSWKVWLEPDLISTKPDEFILNFFINDKNLSKIYQGEIERMELEPLRKDFARLYPILGLEDPFLSSLFAQELESKDYKKIVKDFEQRVSQAKKDMGSIKDKERLLRGLKSLADEAFSLHLELLSQAKLRKIIADFVKKNIKNRHLMAEKND